MKLSNRVAVIAGATGSLGKYITGEFSRVGIRLALLGSKIESLNRLADELNLEDDRTSLHAIDLADPFAAKEAGLEIFAKFNQIDIYLHLIGGWTGGKSIADVQAGDLASMLNQHAWTTFYAAQTFTPYMLANQWGRFIAISSPYGRAPVARRAAFAMGKAAQEALLLSLADELKGTKVTANILVVKTIDSKHERDRNPTPKNASWTTPEEIYNAIQFLCSEEARVVNGARIPLFNA